MKSVLITNERKIDFSKPQLLTSVVNGTVVMSTGEDYEDRFGGFVINDSMGNCPVGHYTDCWSKANFSLFEGKIELSND